MAMGLTKKEPYHSAEMRELASWDAHAAYIRGHHAMPGAPCRYLVYLLPLGHCYSRQTGYTLIRILTDWYGAIRLGYRYQSNFIAGISIFISDWASEASEVSDSTG